MRDAFDVLGVEPRFGLDLTELEAHHRKLSAELHPDRQSASSAAERAAKLTQLSEVNQAYRSLSDPISRAEQLLQRRGESVPATKTAELLQRIFEQRQSVENAKDEGNACRLSDWVTAARARQAALASELSAFFDGEPTVLPAPHQQIAPVFEELRYLKKIIERAERALDELE